MVPDEELEDAIAVIEEAKRNRSFEGERLTQRTYIVLSLILILLTGFVLPLRTSRWHDVSEAGVALQARV